MIANLRNYEPETIEFVVPDSIREKFPPVLFQGSTNVDELIKLVNEHFNATFPESEVTQRLLDEFEISEIREEYCIKQENEVNLKVRLNVITSRPIGIARFIVYNKFDTL